MFLGSMYLGRPSWLQRTYNRAGSSLVGRQEAANATGSGLGIINPLRPVLND